MSTLPKKLNINLWAANKHHSSWEWWTLKNPSKIIFEGYINTSRLRSQLHQSQDEPSPTPANEIYSEHNLYFSKLENKQELSLQNCNPKPPTLERAFKFTANRPDLKSSNTEINLECFWVSSNPRGHSKVKAKPLGLNPPSGLTGTLSNYIEKMCLTFFNHNINRKTTFKNKPKEKTADKIRCQILAIQNTTTKKYNGSPVSQILNPTLQMLKSLRLSAIVSACDLGTHFKPSLDNSR